MTARIIDGKIIAAELRGRVADEVARVRREHRMTPGLAVVLVGRYGLNPFFRLLAASGAREVLTAAALATRWWEPPADALDALVLGAVDTRPLAEAHGDAANPLTSPLLRRNSLADGAGFNGGMYMVVRALTLLRSLCYALDADVSMAAMWAADAAAALAETPATRTAVDAANTELEALEEA